MDPSPVPPSSANPRTSRMAITSLVFGILSLLCLSVLGAIPAVILGHKARGQIRSSGGTIGGAGLALGGLITGYLSLVIFLVSIPILLLAYGQFKQQALAIDCIGNLQQIQFAKEQWAMEAEPADDEVPSTEDLNAFLDQKIEDMKCPSGGTYKINAAKVKPTCSVPGHQLSD